jgi:hypothetical protein
MKTLNTIILALCAAAVPGTTGLYAQNGAVASIPFAFEVQNTMLPAGAYTVKAVSGMSGVIKIENNETYDSVLVLAPNLNSPPKGKDTDTGKIIFHRYGDRYFFAEVWVPNGPKGSVAPSKLERELRASGADKQMASVAVPLAGAL